MWALGGKRVLEEAKQNMLKRLKINNPTDK